MRSSSESRWSLITTFGEASESPYAAQIPRAPSTSTILRIVSGPAAAHPPRRLSFERSKSAWLIRSWNSVSLPEISVHLSRLISASAAPASNVGSVTRHAPNTSAISADSVEPATWKNGRQLK